MDFLEFLFAGFAVFWGGIFVYLLTLQGRIRSLARQIERLQERLDERSGAGSPTPEERP